jgi:hypothetical protein
MPSFWSHSEIGCDANAFMPSLVEQRLRFFQIERVEVAVPPLALRRVRGCSPPASTKLRHICLRFSAVRRLHHRPGSGDFLANELVTARVASGQLLRRKDLVAKHSSTCSRQRLSFPRTHFLWEAIKIR